MGVVDEDRVSVSLIAKEHDIVETSRCPDPAQRQDAGWWEVIEPLGGDDRLQVRFVSADSLDLLLKLQQHRLAFAPPALAKQHLPTSTDRRSGQASAYGP